MNLLILHWLINDGPIVTMHSCMFLRNNQTHKKNRCFWYILSERTVQSLSSMPNNESGGHHSHSRYTSNLLISVNKTQTEIKIALHSYLEGKWPFGTAAPVRLWLCVATHLLSPGCCSISTYCQTAHHSGLLAEGAPRYLKYTHYDLCSVLNL